MYDFFIDTRSNSVNDGITDDEITRVIEIMLTNKKRKKGNKKNDYLQYLIKEEYGCLKDEYFFCRCVLWSKRWSNDMGNGSLTSYFWKLGFWIRNDPKILKMVFAVLQSLVHIEA